MLKRCVWADRRWWWRRVCWSSDTLLCADARFLMSNQLDLLIIGAGPAGLSAADAAAQEGLSYLVIEKGTIANTIRQYPVGRTMFSTPNELEMRAGSLQPIREKPTREELLSHYIHFVLDHDLRISTGEEVIDVSGNLDEGFTVRTRSR